MGIAHIFCQLKYGVLQGSCLGPLLFILLTSNPPREVGKSKYDGADLAFSLYADDTSVAIIARERDNIKAAQEELESGVAWFSALDSLLINSQKTQTLRIRDKSSDRLNIFGVKLLNRTCLFRSVPWCSRVWPYGFRTR